MGYMADKTGFLYYIFIFCIISDGFITVHSIIHLKKQSGAHEMHRLNMLLFVVDIETLVKAINTSAGVNELLLTCKERMAF